MSSGREQGGGGVVWCGVVVEEAVVEEAVVEDGVRRGTRSEILPSRDVTKPHSHA